MYLYLGFNFIYCNCTNCHCFFIENWMCFNCDKIKLVEDDNNFDKLNDTKFKQTTRKCNYYLNILIFAVECSDTFGLCKKRNVIFLLKLIFLHFTLQSNCDT